MIKEIDLTGTLQRIEEGSEQVCMLVPVSKCTTVEELMRAGGFVLIQKKETKDEPKEKPKSKPAKKEKIDTGKILALYRAGWNISSICLEVGASYNTVKKYIDLEKDNGRTAES